LPRPALRVRSRKHYSTKLPGGRTVTHFYRKIRGVAVCAICGRPLSVPRLSPRNAGKLPKTAKRPERIYGGQICGSCLREMIKQSVRMGSYN